MTARARNAIAPLEWHFVEHLIVMSREIIHFSHANGFPSSVYRKLWRLLGDDYEVHAIERIGHDKRYPVTPEWTLLRDELVDTLAREYTEPVWLVGHSLGGFLSLMAAIRAPQRVRGVVMLDSPIVAPGWRVHLLRLSQLTGLYDRLSPARATRTRRTHWDNWDAAWRHFKSKPVFARWDEDMLADYITFGTSPTGFGAQRVLAFEREIEYRIYRTLPRRLGARAQRGVPVPVGFLAGTDSRELRQVGLAATRQLVGERLRYVPGTHLFPMEQPAQTAERLREVLQALGGARDLSVAA